MPLNNITIAFDLENHMIKGVSKISLPAGQSTVIKLAGLKILSASINEKVITVDANAETIPFAPVAADDVLRIEYEAIFNTYETDEGNNPGVVMGNLISPDGIVLLNGWYPSINGLCVYKLSAILPGEFDGISEAEQIIVKEAAHMNREFSFVFPYPVDNINFIGGKYVIEKDQFNETDVYAYFLPEDLELSKTYMEYTKKYLTMYEALFGKFPFKRFSIVENLLPTGYSMPTLTLLGQDVVKLPFIVKTSLGHEVLHQWFGNLVYPHNQGGNWSEGLTTYLADHRYKELEGKGWDYRKQSLIGFQSYITPENDFPLTSFTSRTDRISGAIGYRKALMVFHMLKNLVGEEVFYKALRVFIEKNKFRLASWDDIKNAFESTWGNSLGWFFKQWVEEKGIPKIEVQNIEIRYQGAKAIVSFEILQKGQNYKLWLPVLLQTRGDELRKTFEISENLNVLEIEIAGIPEELIIDADYDVFRKLSDKEYPPVISRLLGDTRRIFVIPSGRDKEYTVTGEFLEGQGFKKLNETEISYDDMKTGSLLIPGTETNLVKKLFGKIEKQDEEFYLLSKVNPLNTEGIVAIIDGSSSSDINSYIKKITHYGKYSCISFKDGKNTSKQIEKSKRGMRFKLAEEIKGVEIARLTNISYIIEKISDKKIIYIGESHNRFEHHRVQLEVIRELHKINKKIAIGMEMFQKPFQKALDGYIDGNINEKEFLKKSEYFDRWGFDYNLYREILLYAREYRIPVIALNIDREIVRKVSHNGIHALTKEEMREIPEYFDISDNKYRQRLRYFFERHKSAEARNFDFFYQAQVLWDESMAHNLNAFMEDNPGYQIIVIAGREHMAFGSGIPKRTHRLNPKEYAIILNAEEFDSDIADFVLYPPPLKMPASPKLMVTLKQEVDGKVKLVDFEPDSISKNSGLKKNDILLFLDDLKIEAIEDVKIFLLDKKKGDEITVKVSRKKFLSGNVEKIFKLTL